MALKFDQPPTTATSDDTQKELDDAKALLRKIDTGHKETIDALVESKGKDISVDELKSKIKGPKSEKVDKEKVADLKKNLDKAYSPTQKEKEDKLIDSRMKEIGLTKKDFVNMPEWGELSEGQKMLVLDQVSQNTLSRVKEIGEERFKGKNTINASLNPSQWKTTVVKKIWNKLGKSYWISKEEKSAIEDAKMGRIKPKTEDLNAFVHVAADMKLNVEVKDGKPLIKFLETNMSLPKEKQKAYDELNKIANEFSKIPDTWGSEKAAAALKGKILKPNQSKYYERFEATKKHYEEVRNAIIETETENAVSVDKMDKVGAEAKAMKMAEDLDNKIWILQTYNTNPDAMEELRRIENESSYKRLLDNENIWRGIYMSTGFIARKGVTKVMGVFAAPLVAGTMGAARGRMRANKKINSAFNEGTKEGTFLEKRASGNKEEGIKKNILKTMGEAISGPTKIEGKRVAAFVDADSQILRINTLMEKMDGEKSESEKARLRSELEKRLDYIEEKHEDHLINYGKSTSRSYELVKGLSMARMKLSMMEPIDLNQIPDELITIKDLGEDGKVIGTREIQLRDLIKDELHQRGRLLESIMAKNEKALGKNQANIKYQEMMRGFVTGAGFSYLGSRISSWVSGKIGHLFNESNQHGESQYYHPSGQHAEALVGPKPNELPHHSELKSVHGTEHRRHAMHTKAPHKVVALKTEIEKPDPIEAPDKVVAGTEITHEVISPKLAVINPRLGIYNQSGEMSINPTGTHPDMPSYETGNANYQYQTGNINAVHGPNAGANIEHESVPSHEGGDTASPESQVTIEKHIEAPTSSAEDMQHIESEPLHDLHNAKEVVAGFGKDNVVVSSPEHPTVNNISYKDWNETSDKLFESNNLKYDSYEAYESDHEMQQLFGHGTHGTQYIESTGKTVPATNMNYYKTLDSWQTINKMPAKYFFNADGARLSDGSAISNDDFVKLLNDKVFRDTVFTDINGNEIHGWSFSNKDELMRLANTYADAMHNPLAAQPFENETITEYITRLTKHVGQAQDGTFYAGSHNETLSELHESTPAPKPEGTSIEHHARRKFFNFGNNVERVSDNAYYGGPVQTISPDHGRYQLNSDYHRNGTFIQTTAQAPRRRRGFLGTLAWFLGL